MAVLISAFLALAAIGLASVVVVHVAALLGATGPFEHCLKYLGPGVFIVWLPTVLVMIRLTRDFKQKDVWRAALRGCPQWMRRLQWVIVGYAWVGGFALPIVFGGGMEAPANAARSMSAVMLLFYSISVSVLYSATRADKLDESRRCLNGHRMAPLAKYCEECGAPVATGITQVR
ncbi:MAG TPA: hypothetical protein VMS96_14880 [Terriglobales bacterium]|nr:hypothetical protein [Terriglobales bacterium]